MSEQKNSNTPPPSEPAPGEEAAEAQERSAAQPAAAATETENAAFEQQLTSPARRSGFPLLATLTLLLVIALAAASGWVIKEAERREAALLDRLVMLEEVTEREVLDATEQQASLRALGAKVERDLQADLERGLSSLAPRIERQSSHLQKLDASLQTLEQGVARQSEELARFSASDREGWLVAEVQYLLRLANQRLIMTGDAVSAQALMSSADTVLRQLEDSAFYPVRKAIAADLSALRAVLRIDTEGLYLRLSALSDAALALSIFELPEAEQPPQTPAADNWRGRLQQGYQAALNKISDYVIIRRRETPMDILMDPQWEGLVRQNLRMLLEQAQVALLSSNSRLFRESLERSRHWVSQFAESDGQAATAMDEELQALAAENIEVALPDISRSLNALSQAVDVRAQRAQEKGE